MTFWWLRLPFIYWLSGRKSKERYYKRNIDLMTADIISFRKKAIEKHGVVEESMGVVDRYLISGEVTDQEIMWETITFFTAVSILSQRKRTINCKCCENIGFYFSSRFYTYQL